MAIRRANSIALRVTVGTSPVGTSQIRVWRSDSKFSDDPSRVMVGRHSQPSLYDAVSEAVATYLGRSSFWNKDADWCLGPVGAGTREWVALAPVDD
jgi:hypothetical protein